MFTDKKELRVMVLEPGEESLNKVVLEKVKTLLLKDFKCNFKTISEVKNIGYAYYNLRPHFIILDSSFKNLLDNLKEFPGHLEKILDLPVIVLETDENTRIDFLDSRLNIIDFIPYNSSEKEIIEKIDLAASKAGFVVKKGKIDNRLVKRKIPISITVDNFDLKIEGETTGLNEKGLGARVNAYDKSISELKNLAGRNCRVDFLDYSLGFMPVYGTVIRFAKGRGLRYKAFVAVSFNTDRGQGFGKAELDILRELIENQKDDSIKKQA